MVHFALADKDQSTLHEVVRGAAQGLGGKLAKPIHHRHMKARRGLETLIRVVLMVDHQLEFAKLHSVFRVRPIKLIADDFEREVGFHGVYWRF